MLQNASYIFSLILECWRVITYNLQFPKLLQNSLLQKKQSKTAFFNKLYHTHDILLENYNEFIENLQKLVIGSSVYTSIIKND